MERDGKKRVVQVFTLTGSYYIPNEFFMSAGIKDNVDSTMSALVRGTRGPFVTVYSEKDMTGPTTKINANFIQSYVVFFE